MTPVEKARSMLIHTHQVAATLPGCVSYYVPGELVRDALLKEGIEANTYLVVLGSKPEGEHCRALYQHAILVVDGIVLDEQGRTGLSAAREDMKAHPLWKDYTPEEADMFPVDLEEEDVADAARLREALAAWDNAQALDHGTPVVSIFSARRKL